MKKLLTLSLILTLALMSSCKKDEVTKIEVTKIEVSPNTLSIVEGNTNQFEAKVFPENAFDKNVSWSSSDKNIATVSEKGLVTAIKDGKVNISATSSNGIKGSSEITVTAKFINVESVSIVNSETEIIVGKTLQLCCKFFPIDATNKNVTWSSSDETIATVSETGLITGIKEGDFNIMVVSENGLKENSISLKIIPATVEEVKIKSYCHEIENYKYAAHTLTAIVLPLTAKDRTYTWKSSNENVATINNKGEVSVKGIGTTTMTVTTNEGNKTASYDIEIIEGKTTLRYLKDNASRNDDKKEKGDWVCPKLFFDGAEKGIDMDYTFNYQYNKSEATINFYYKSASGELKSHKSLIQLTKTGFTLETPFEINGKTLSEFAFNENDKIFTIKSDELIGMLDTKINGIPVYSLSDKLMRHRLESGELDHNYSKKMLEYKNNILELLDLKEGTYSDFKFELFTYDEEVPYEGNDNMFLIRYYSNKSSHHHPFFFSKNYGKTEDGSIIFNKLDNNGKWYDNNDDLCKKIVVNEKTTTLLDIIFSDKGWKVIEEKKDSVFVLISNEDPSCWFRLWVYFDENDY